MEFRNSIRFGEDAAAELWIAGRGDYEGELRRLAVGRPKVRFLGQCSSQRLRALYEDKDQDIRRRVVQLLIHTYDPLSDHRRAVTDLLRRAREDTSRRVRELVEEGHKTHGEEYLEPYLSPIEDE